MIKVTIIGSGNVGFHLVNLFHNSTKIKLNEWCSRSLDFDERIEVINEIENLSESDIYVICVSDKSITEVSDKIQFKNKLVVHTSGSTSYNSLNNNNRRGVFYPLQTFSKSQKLNYSEIPICIEAENDKDLETLKKSLLNFIIMVVLSIVTAYLFFSFFPLREESSELLSRTKPDIRDILIAFFGGLALIIAKTKNI